MYFIEYGKVAVKLPNGQIVKTLGDGTYFGGKSEQVSQDQTQGVSRDQLLPFMCEAPVNYQTQTRSLSANSQPSYFVAISFPRLFFP